MNLYPNLYLKSIINITYEMLSKNNIKALALDVDNTLIDYNKNLVPGAEEWCEKLKQLGIKICILSNSANKTKVQNVAKKLNIPYICFAKKPFKSGFIKAQELLQEKNENIAMVGDQISSDIIGANNCNMFSILVEPVHKKDIFVTAIKRPLEKIIIKRYLKARKERD